MAQLLLLKAASNAAVGRVEGQAADELQRLRGADEAVHPGVLPLDRDGPVVADRVEHPEAGLPRHVAVPGGHEVPAAARIGPGEVRAHPAVATVAHLTLRVLAVDVVDPVLEVPEEADRVEVLPDEVAGIPVESEGGSVTDRVHGSLGRPVVVGDLARMHLMREPDALIVEDVEDRVPSVREVLVAVVDHRLGHWREHRHGLPDLRPGEADDGVHAETAGRPCGHLHLLGGPLPDAFGVAVAPDAVGQDPAVALVDRVVADGLSLEVVGDREELQVVLLQQVELVPHVAVVLGGLPDIEVVPPAGDLQPVIAPLGREPAHLDEGQVGPLAGEQGDRSRHVRSSSSGVVWSPA